jgi:hypothetical protein
MARCVTTAGDESRARLIVERLAEAGIRAWSSGIVELAPATRDVYVEDADLDRARSVLREAESISEDELVQAEEEDKAARDARTAE